MDYVTRQFIVLAKKLRDEFHKLHETLHRDLSHLSNGLKDLKDAVDREEESNTERGEVQPSVSVTDPRTEIPVSIKTYAQHSTKERVWGYIKGALEIAVGTAVIGYTALTWNVWQEQIDATNFAARQTEISRKGMNEALKNFRSDERARVGVPRLNIGPSALKKIVPNVEISGNGEVENFGKSPAVIDGIGVKLEVRSTPVPDDFKYPMRKPGTFLLYPGELGVRTNDDTYKIPIGDFAEVEHVGRKRLYLHGSVHYHDGFGRYTTMWCFYWGGGQVNLFSPCLEHNSAD